MNRRKRDDELQQELAAQAPGTKVVIPPPGEGIEL